MNYLYLHPLGLEGVVTAADVLEAIVGDPSDTETQPGGEDGDGEAALVMDGLMPVDELKSRLALPDLPASAITVGLLGASTGPHLGPDLMGACFLATAGSHEHATA